MASGIELWLQALDLDQYADAFRSNAVDMDLLPDLDEDDLEKLGVVALGHRKILLRAIAMLTGTDAATNDVAHDTADVPQRQREVAIHDHIAHNFRPMMGLDRILT